MGEPETALEEVKDEVVVVLLRPFVVIVVGRADIRNQEHQRKSFRQMD